MSKPYVNSTQVADSIPYDNSTSEISSTDVRSALDEIDNYSSKDHTFPGTQTIPNGRALLVDGSFHITGILNIKGTLKVT